MEAMEDPLGNMGDIVENATTLVGGEEEETKDGTTPSADEPMNAAA